MERQKEEGGRVEGGWEETDHSKCSYININNDETSINLITDSLVSVCVCVLFLLSKLLFCFRDKMINIEF